MAVIKSSALYGTGVYSGSVFGTRNVSFALTGVAGTGAIEPVAAGGFEIDISERLGSVSATGSIGTISPNIQEDVSGVSATGAIGTLTFSTSHSLASVSATGSIGTLTISNTVGLTGVAGTTAVEAVAAGGFEVDVSEKVTGVSATGAVTAVQPVFSFSQELTGVGLTGSIGTLSLNVKEELGANSVTSVSATGSINTVTVHVKEKLTSVSATGRIQDTPPTAATQTASLAAALGNSVHVKITAVQFDFEATASQYSRRRTIILPRVA